MQYFLYLCSGIMTISCQRIHTYRSCIRETKGTMMNKILYVLLRIILHINSLLAIMVVCAFGSLFLWTIGYLIETYIHVNVMLSCWPMWFFWGSFCLLFFTQRHLIQWYDRKHPAKMECPKCHKEVSLSVDSPYFKELSGFGNILRRLFIQEYQGMSHDVKVTFFRPRLYLQCPQCGEEKVICPYCKHEIDSMVNKCPHCGKRIEDLASPMYTQCGEEMKYNHEG